MSDMTYKKITEVEQLSFLNDDAKLFINQDNAIKQYSAKQLLNEYVPESTNPHQYLTTDADGNKVWENKLTYSSMEDVPFLEEKVWTGEETESFTATRSVDVGDKITLYVDDIPYTGTLENFYGMGWIIHFDEEYPELSAAIKTAIITPPKMAFKTDTPQGIIGKISATVLTDVIHPIDNKYLAFNISQGSTSPESISINGQASDSKGFKTVSINGGKASGLHSIAFHEGSEASGLNTFAAAGGKAEGPHSVAFGYNAHSIGQFSMAIGENNIADEKYLFVVGNGTSDKAKANAHTLDISGNAKFAGDVYVQGTGTEDLQDAKKLATEEYVEEKLLDSDLVRATAFNELADTVKGLDKYCAFMKQGDQIKLGNVQEYSKMQEMLSGANKFHATLAVSYVNEEGLLISETCYAKSVMAAIDMETGSKPYVNFSFETFDGETIKFQWNADNTISNVVTIAATPAEEAEV